MSSRGIAWRVVCGGIFAEGQAYADEVRTILSSYPIDWPQVVILADSHFVSPALWLGLKAQGLTESLPQDSRQYLQALYEMNLARSIGMTAQLKETIEALNRRNISPLLLKGAAYLMLGTHGDPGARIVCDLDLLIPGDEIEAARCVLTGMGYSPKHRSDRPGHHHLAPLIRDGSPAAIELHRDVLVRWAQKVAPAALIWRHRTICEGGAYSVPCATHAVLHRFVHDQIVDRHAAQFLISLRSMQDLAALEAFYGQDIDWRWLNDQAQRFGYTKQLGNYVYAASRVTGAVVPAPIKVTQGHAINFYVCRAVERSRSMSHAIAILERFSSNRIQRQYADGGSLTGNRVRLLARMIKSAFS